MSKDAIFALFILVFMVIVAYCAFRCTPKPRHYHPTKQKTEYDNYRPSSHKMPSTSSTYHM